MAAEEGLGDWMQECWYDVTVESCTGNEVHCWASVMRDNGKWFDGPCDEMEEKVREIQAKRADKREDRQEMKKEERKEAK